MGFKGHSEPDLRVYEREGYLEVSACTVHGPVSQPRSENNMTHWKRKGKTQSTLRARHTQTRSLSSRGNVGRLNMWFKAMCKQQLLKHTLTFHISTTSKWMHQLPQTRSTQTHTHKHTQTHRRFSETGRWTHLHQPQCTLAHFSDSNSRRELERASRGHTCLVPYLSYSWIHMQRESL